MREQDRQLVLELTRWGNTEEEVTVSCFTQADTASNDIDFEQLDQRVTFGRNETRARCTVDILDDTVYEGKERFYVFVRGRPGELVNSTLDERPLCVYIVYDPNDGKGTSEREIEGRVRVRMSACYWGKLHVWAS